MQRSSSSIVYEALHALNSIKHATIPSETIIVKSIVSSIQQGREKLHFLQAINAQLEESHHFKNQLLLTINHEIGSPLSAAKGFTVLLQTYRHELDEETQTRYLEQNERACDETTAIVESLITDIQ